MNERRKKLGSHLITRLSERRINQAAKALKVGRLTK